MSTPATLYVGRAGQDGGTILVDTLNLEGEVLTVTGTLYDDTEYGVKVLRQQMLGLTDSSDDPVVPIQFSGDTTTTGFYEVTQVSVASPDDGFWQIQGALPFQLTARRISGYSYPLVQSVLQLFCRTNSVGIASVAAAIWAVPQAWSEVYWGPNVAETPSTRTSADGAILVYNNASAAGVFTASAGVTPASFYTGAAKIEVGSTLRTVVGRQLDRANGTPAQWRLSNGLIRVTPTTSGGSATGGLTLQWYDGASWEPTNGKLFELWDFATTNAIGAFSTLRILRNTPEFVAIRLSALQPGYSSGYYCTVDLMLRRGCRHVEIILSGTSITTTGWQVRRASVEAATAITGGIRATANDADANRFIIASPSTCTADTTNGRLRLTTAAKIGQFAIGVELGGSGATGDDAAAAVATQYIEVCSEHQSVIGR